MPSAPAAAGGWSAAPGRSPASPSTRSRTSPAERAAPSCPATPPRRPAPAASATWASPSPATTGYTVSSFGLRAHLPAINAAIGRAQLARFPAAAAHRDRLWRAYREALTGLGGVTLVDLDIDRTVPFNCVIRLASGRDEVFSLLRGQGVGVGVHYPPNHAQPAFATWRRPLPRTEMAAAQVLSLPFHPALGPQDASRVAGLLREALR
jgi:dTDP-4-amino-4,6-dideoxygalactose transaminase